MSIHLQVSRDNIRTKVHVNREDKTVFVELPNGDLRYSSNDVESALRLPLYAEPVAPSPLEVEPADKSDKDKGKVLTKTDDKDDKKNDKLVEAK